MTLFKAVGLHIIQRLPKYCYNIMGYDASSFLQHKMPIKVRSVRIFKFSIFHFLNHENIEFHFE